MKIGIVTYHRSHNHGALLQAIALRKVLADMGHDVSYIDYWPEYHKQLYDLISVSSMKYRGLYGNIKYLISRIKRYNSIKERIKNFELFISKYIQPHVSCLNDKYDIVVYGSDQIWRKQKELHAYDYMYFGKGEIKADMKISYAASMGLIKCTEEDKSVLKMYFAYLDSISVREASLNKFLSELGYNSVISLDPTLLLNSTAWMEIMNISSYEGSRYLLHYKLQSNAFDEDEIVKYASRHNLKVITLYGVAVGKDTDCRISCASPDVFLSLISNASMVITSSYHGVVFSILMHRPFFASFKSNAGRAQSLLHDLDLDNRLIDNNSAIPEIQEEINFLTVDSKLQTLREKSINYLFEKTKQIYINNKAKDESIICNSCV